MSIKLIKPQEENSDPVRMAGLDGAGLPHRRSSLSDAGALFNGIPLSGEYSLFNGLQNKWALWAKIPTFRYNPPSYSKTELKEDLETTGRQVTITQNGVTVGLEGDGERATAIAKIDLGEGNGITIGNTDTIRSFAFRFKVTAFPALTDGYGHVMNIFKAGGLSFGLGLNEGTKLSTLSWRDGWMSDTPENLMAKGLTSHPQGMYNEFNTGDNCFFQMCRYGLQCGVIGYDYDNNQYGHYAWSNNPDAPWDGHGPETVVWDDTTSFSPWESSHIALNTWYYVKASRTYGALNNELKGGTFRVNVSPWGYESYGQYRTCEIPDNKDLWAGDHGQSSSWDICIGAQTDANSRQGGKFEFDLGSLRMSTEPWVF